MKYLPPLIAILSLLLYGCATTRYASGPGGADFDPFYTLSSAAHIHESELRFASPGKFANSPDELDKCKSMTGVIGMIGI